MYGFVFDNRLILQTIFSENNMIIVTGAAGFIGSGLIQRLNQDNFNFIIA